MRRALVPAALAVATLALWLSAGTAFAAGSTTAVPGEAHLYLSGAFYVGHDAVTVPGRMVEVQGFVRPYLPGQTVEVMSYVGRRRFKRDVLRIKPAGSGVGGFTERVRRPGAGIVRVKVTHRATPQMRSFSAERALAALQPSVGPGDRGLM